MNTTQDDKAGSLKRAGSAKVCLKPNCGEKATSRGLCPSCYRVARMLVKEHKTTWQQLEESGKCAAAKYCRESSTRDWFLCLNSDGGHIHELHANDTLSPNVELSDGTPKTNTP